MTKAEEVIERLEEENRTYSIKVLGDEKNKDNAFGIIANIKDRIIFAEEKEVYRGIGKKTFLLLKEAEIEFGVI